MRLCSDREIWDMELERWLSVRIIHWLPPTFSSGLSTNSVSEQRTCFLQLGSDSLCAILRPFVSPCFSALTFLDAILIKKNFQSCKVLTGQTQERLEPPVMLGPLSIRRPPIFVPALQTVHHGALHITVRSSDSLSHMSFLIPFPRSGFMALV